MIDPSSLARRLDAPIGRRAMLRASVAGLAALALPGCASPRGVGAGPALGAAPSRPLVPVRVGADRLIRAVSGLRPFRPSGFDVRVEMLDSKPVIHNYGHGGAGITLSWGTAELAAELAEGTGRTRFAVLGSGVAGLTTARRLQDRGYRVTIYSRDLPPDTTSNIAGGLWSPASVADFGETTPAFREQFERAARFSHRYFQTLAGPGYGVRWLDNFTLSESPPGGGGGGFQGLIPDLFPGGEVLPPGTHAFGPTFARRVSSMMIEPAPFLRALTHDFLARGGTVEVRELRSRSEVVALEEPAVVNCCGLGAKALFGDPQLLPIKGQLAVLVPQPEIDYMVLSGGYYMFPRADGIILGGTHERGVDTATVEPETIQRILEANARMFRYMPPT